MAPQPASLKILEITTIVRKYSGLAMKKIGCPPHNLINAFTIPLLGPNGGMVNALIKLCGGQPIFFMAKPEYFRTIVVISSIFKEAGWGAIVYIAALAGI